jgi:hypothetical protein
MSDDWRNMMWIRSDKHTRELEKRPIISPVYNDGGILISITFSSPSNNILPISLSYPDEVKCNPKHLKTTSEYVQKLREVTPKELDMKQRKNSRMGVNVCLKKQLNHLLAEVSSGAMSDLRMKELKNRLNKFQRE